MHQCTHCQAELPEHAQFCSRCGTPVPYDQAESSNHTNFEGEQSEDTFQAEQELGQSSDALVDSAAPAEGPAPLAEDQPSEVSQQSGEVAAEEDMSADREESPANEATGEGSEEDVPEPATLLAQTSSEEIIEDAGGPPQAFEQTDLEGTDQSEPGARDEDTQSEPMLADAHGERGQKGAGKRWLVVALVVLLIVAGCAGAFVFIRQQTAVGASSQCAASQQASCTSTATGNNHTHVTQLTFSGSISGSMAVSALVRCQATTTQNLRTLMVTLSGTVGGQLYNFGFVINNYTGPGTYNATSPALTVLLDVPGEATNNGWGNTSTTDSGTITIAHGEQTGSIAYVLSGFGTRAGSQVQISGDWTCG